MANVEQPVGLESENLGRKGGSVGSKKKTPSSPIRPSSPSAAIRPSSPLAAAAGARPASPKAAPVRPPSSPKSAAVKASSPSRAAASQAAKIANGVASPPSPPGAVAPSAGRGGVLVSRPSPVIIRAPSPVGGGRRRAGRRGATFKKSASLRLRKEADEGGGGGGGGGEGMKKGGSSEDEDEEDDEGRLKQGPWFLKLAKTYHAQGDNPTKAFQFASRAIQCFEKSAAGKCSLDLVVSLHILAALQCRLGRFEEAVDLLERALRIPDPDAGGMDHTLATFAGRMQLGDTLALQGKHQLALASYRAALEVQKRSLGELDLRVAETCRYVAEAHLQAMQVEEAGELCELALKIHQEKKATWSGPGVEEAADRRLMAMVCSGKGDHEGALEHLVLSSTVLLANGLESDVAAVDATIGDALCALGRDTEAALSYQKALTMFKATKGEGHATVASVFVRLAELGMKTGKPREAKTYADSALRIYGAHGVGQGVGQGQGHALEDVVYGLTDIAGVYDLLGQREQAISLLSRAADLQGSAPGQTFTSAGVEAQLGVLYFMVGRFPPAYKALQSATTKLKCASGGKRSLFMGLLLNQLGLTAVELGDIQEATGILEEAKTVMDGAVGPVHEDTLDVCSNLAGTYDALGRTDEAITLLETVVDIKEGKFGLAHPEVEDESQRLAQLLQQMGRSRTRRTNTLEELLSMAKQEMGRA